MNLFSLITTTTTSITTITITTIITITNTTNNDIIHVLFISCKNKFHIYIYYINYFYLFDNKYFIKYGRKRCDFLSGLKYTISILHFKDKD